MLATKLFETGWLSLGQVASLAAYSKPTFVELLGRMGILVLDYPAEDLAGEVDL